MDKINNPWQCGMIVGADNEGVFPEFHVSHGLGGSHGFSPHETG